MSNEYPNMRTSLARTAGFDGLGLVEALMKNLKDSGYKTPTPIQVKAIPHVLKGKDLLGWSVAGAGDVNQDGCADVIVGAPCADPGGTDSAGSAFVYSIGPS